MTPKLGRASYSTHAIRPVGARDESVSSPIRSCGVISSGSALRTFGAAVCLVALLPSLAWGAQPVVANQPPAAQAQPPIVGAPPVRYVLQSGTVVEGSTIGEDETFYTVQTAQGAVRVRKLDVARIETTAPPTYTPATAVPAPEPRHRRTGPIVMTAVGFGVFGGFWLITFFVGAIGSIVDSDASWLMVPVAGPMLYYTVGDLDSSVLGLMIMDTLVQTAGVVTGIIGVSMLGDSSEQARAGDLDLVLGPGSVGLRSIF